MFYFLFLYFATVDATLVDAAAQTLELKTEEKTTGSEASTACSIQDLQERIAELENMLAIRDAEKSSSSDASPDTSDGEGLTAKDQEIAALRAENIQQKQQNQELARALQGALQFDAISYEKDMNELRNMIADSKSRMAQFM